MSSFVYSINLKQRHLSALSNVCTMAYHISVSELMSADEDKSFVRDAKLSTLKCNGTNQFSVRVFTRELRVLLPYSLTLG